MAHQVEKPAGGSSSGLRSIAKVVTLAVGFVTLAGGLLTGAYTYFQFSRDCAPTPLVQCFMDMLAGSIEKEAHKEWELKIGRATDTAEIQEFLRKYERSSLGVAAARRLALAREFAVLRVSGDPKSFKAFIEKTSDPEFLTMAKGRLDSLDDEAWAAALRRGTLEGYEEYIVKFSMFGRQNELASKRINEKRHELGWQKASSTRTVVALRQYLKDWPRGEFRRQAQDWLVELEAQAWLRFEKNPRLATLTAYLAEEWSDGAHWSEARARLIGFDDESWENARRARSSRSAREYLRTFPKGSHRPAAEQLIADLDDEEAWQTATSSDTAEAYSAYVQRFPQGQFVRQARMRLDERIDDAAYRRARALDTPSSYAEFKREQKTGRHLAAIDQRLGELDESAWQRARSADSVQGLRGYLLDWPEGARRADARRRLAELEAPDECDSLAANPDDPGRKGSGVLYAVLVPDPAIRACEAAVKLLPQDVRLKYQLARAYQKAGQWPEARRLLTEAVASRYVAAYDNLGWLYANGQGMARNDKVALSYFQQAAGRGHAESMYSLYAFHLERGRADEAQRWLRQAAQRGYRPAIDRLGREPMASDAPSNPKSFKEGLENLKEGFSTFKDMIDQLKKSR